MNDKEMIAELVNNAAPYITLSYVIDKGGLLLANFLFHPQTEDECQITLDKVSGDRQQIMLEPNDVHDFADRLHKFADLAEIFVRKYHERN